MLDTLFETQEIEAAPVAGVQRFGGWLGIPNSNHKQHNVRSYGRHRSPKLHPNWINDVQMVVEARGTGVSTNWGRPKCLVSFCLHFRVASLSIPITESVRQTLPLNSEAAGQGDDM